MKVVVLFLNIIGTAHRVARQSVKIGPRNNKCGNTSGTIGSRCLLMGDGKTSDAKQMILTK